MSLYVTLKTRNTEKTYCHFCDNESYEHKELYSSNITHNLGAMAKAAGIYTALWRPDEGGYKYAGDIKDILLKGLNDLKARPDHFKNFNSENGWGLYKHFVPFVEEYYNACVRHPNSIIEVSR